MSSSDQWTSDVPISAPKADNTIIGLPAADLGGFVFVAGAMRLPVTSVLHESRYIPSWSPKAHPARGRGRRGSTS